MHGTTSFSIIAPQQEDGLAKVTKEYVCVVPTAYHKMKRSIGLGVEEKCSTSNIVYEKSGEWPKLVLFERIGLEGGVHSTWTKIGGEVSSRSYRIVLHCTVAVSACEVLDWWYSWLYDGALLYCAPFSFVLFSSPHSCIALLLNPLTPPLHIWYLPIQNDRTYYL